MNLVIFKRKLLDLHRRQIALRERIEMVDPAAHLDVDSQIALTRDRNDSVLRRVRHAESKIERVVGKVRPPMATVAKSNRCRIQGSPRGKDSPEVRPAFGKPASVTFRMKRRSPRRRVEIQEPHLDVT